MSDAASVRRAYKGLSADGRSPYQDQFKWPLPAADAPGEWVEVKGRPVLCRNGFHGWKSIDDVTQPAIYEIELAGEFVEDAQKIAATRARLLRIVPRPRGELLEEGIRLCRVCLKPHNLYKVRRGQSWADPDDGHSYMSENWESLARRLYAEKQGIKLEPNFNWTGSL